MIQRDLQKNFIFFSQFIKLLVMHKPLKEHLTGHVES